LQEIYKKNIKELDFEPLNNILSSNLIDKKYKIRREDPLKNDQLNFLLIDASYE